MSVDYRDSLSVAAKGVNILRPFLEESANGLVMISKGRLAKWLQESIGDVLLNVRGDETVSVEIKTEAEHTGNLFLETWSNRNLDSVESYWTREPKVGWLLSLRASQMLYYFLDVDTLYCLDMRTLKRWAFGCKAVDGTYHDPKIHQCPFRVIQKCRQPNDTCGYLVPVDVLREGLGRGFKQTNVLQRQLLEDPVTKALGSADTRQAHA